MTLNYVKDYLKLLYFPASTHLKCMSTSWQSGRFIPCLPHFFTYLKFIYKLQIIILEIKNDNLGLLTASKKIDTVDNHDLYYVK